MDLVLQVQHAPGPGETVLADALHLVPGGKGGNQAVACARQGARVALFGRVGDDGYGHTLRAGLDADGIDHSGVQTDTDTTTGVAAITVEATGQNRIVVVPGANGRFVLDAVALGTALHGAGGLVLQFETPLPQVLAAAEMAHAAGCPVVLNPSPIQPLPDAMCPLVHTLVVNEVEAAALAGQNVTTPADAAQATPFWARWPWRWQAASRSIPPCARASAHRHCASRSRAPSPPSPPAPPWRTAPNRPPGAPCETHRPAARRTLPRHRHPGPRRHAGD